MAGRGALFKRHGACTVGRVRLLALLLLLPGAPLAAQIVTPDPQALPGSPLYRAPSITADPAAAYITPGQDEPGYRKWFAAAQWRATYIKAFNDYLATYEVAGIVPTWQLLRTATMWRECGADPFEVPPSSDWPNVVQTLRYVRDYVVPAVGPVEPVSAYRNPTLNICAGGAPLSAHQDFHAVDLVPLLPTTREHLMATLCAAHLRRGGGYQVGLGFYAFLRFHIDSSRYRKWGTADADSSAACRVAIVRAPLLPLPPAPVAAPQGDPAPAPEQPAVVPPDPLAPLETPH